MQRGASGHEAMVILRQITKHYDYALRRLDHQTWAGCSSEESLDNSGVSTAYVVEPRIRVTKPKDFRALILVLTLEANPTEAYIVLDALWEKVKTRKTPEWTELKIALQFYLDRRFDENQPTQEAVLAMLGYRRRSYLGNDRKRGMEILRNFRLKVRALQNSKVRRPGMPKRPKERAEPTHEWLPSWQVQSQAFETSVLEDQPELHELLAPSEILHHLSRSP